MINVTHWKSYVLFAVTFAAILALAPGSARAQGSRGRACTATADALARAWGFEVQDDYWKGMAICTNISEEKERARCFANVIASRVESDKLCRAQSAGRLNACSVLGEAPYDPEFDTDSFEQDFTHLMNPNPYFPLSIGAKWEYRGGAEVNTLEVLNQTKLIDDVPCIVVRDLVYDNGELKEATDDWYAQAKDRNVWYCGEEVKNYESFAGDVPQVPELVTIDGSFKAGRNGDKPGIIFQAAPAPGQTYLEEFSLGNAEDVTEVLSATYSYGQDQELDKYVPRQLADIFCAGNCVVTKNYSLLEPGVFGRKYYARGIGVFLEVNPDTGEIHQLTNCNFDARCNSLPAPARPSQGR